MARQDSSGEFREFENHGPVANRPNNSTTQQQTASGFATPPARRRLPVAHARPSQAKTAPTTWLFALFHVWLATATPPASSRIPSPPARAGETRSSASWDRPATSSVEELT